jgi:hypothetical protein
MDTIASIFSRYNNSAILKGYNAGFLMTMIYSVENPKDRNGDN